MAESSYRKHVFYMSKDTNTMNTEDVYIMLRDIDYSASNDVYDDQVVSFSSVNLDWICFISKQVSFHFKDTNSNPHQILELHKVCDEDIDNISNLMKDYLINQECDFKIIKILNNHVVDRNVVYDDRTISAFSRPKTK